jgi:hypothetical protein
VVPLWHKKKFAEPLPISNFVVFKFLFNCLKIIFSNKNKNLANLGWEGEQTNCMHRNRGNLTVGLKNETVEIVGIIFPHPQPQKLWFWE